MKFDKFSPPAKENKYAHRRQVTPGDYKRKLSHTTIASLNNTFGPILEWLKK
jgi:hypothetical protein